MIRRVLRRHRLDIFHLTSQLWVNYEKVFTRGPQVISQLRCVRLPWEPFQKFTCPASVTKPQSGVPCMLRGFE
jgi:hypothetical protein